MESHANTIKRNLAEFSYRMGLASSDNEVLCFILRLHLRLARRNAW